MNPATVMLPIAGGALAQFVAGLLVIVKVLALMIFVVIKLDCYSIALEDYSSWEQQLAMIDCS
jgi:hypothetical protein